MEGRVGKDSEMVPQPIEKARFGLGMTGAPLGLAKGKVALFRPSAQGRLQADFRSRAGFAISFRSGVAVDLRSGFAAFGEAWALEPPLAFTSAA
jgi:hypothetical protein